jgi:eukaryotic-like serine/threonine-protein kinase
MSNASAVEALFFAALEKGTAAERAAYLDSACGGDAGLRRQVEKLLHAHAKVGDFLQKPVSEQLAAAPEPSDVTQELDASTDDGQRAASTADKGPTLALTDGGTVDDDGNLDFLELSSRPDSLGRIGHYEVLEVLGRGGFGIVFRALDEVLQRVVAVKVLAPKLAVSSAPRKRFLREACLSAKVRHENVVQVYAVEEQPLPYLVMEFIPGETLQERLDRTGPLETLEAVQIGRQLSEGLSAAHGMGLIHRDIKPGNILLESGPQPRAKITDFGLARAADDASLSQSGLIAGTPMFMSPEQAQGEAHDHRADLFSLGSVLYTMTSGRPPFRAKNTLAVLKRVAEETPRPIPEIVPEVPQWLCAIITRLQAKKPEDRFASAREVADLLGQHLAQMQHPGNVTAPQLAPAIKMPRPQKIQEAASPMRRPRFRIGRWAAAAAVLLILLGGFAFTEATGVTDLQGTAIRLFSPEGTLVVEVDDPRVSVKIDGSDIVITGAGAQEIRLKPGRYKVEASKDGKLVRQQLVTVTQNGREVVRVSQEAAPTALKKTSEEAADTKAAKAAADAAAWERAVSKLPPTERAKAVARRLQEINPGFDGAVATTAENGLVTGLKFTTDRVIDIAPVRVLGGLRSLHCSGSDAFKGQLIDQANGQIKIRSVGKSGLTDLAPLKGLPLRSLSCANSNVFDLAPLVGMKLTSLNVDCSLVFDLSPLKGMPLTELRCVYTRVADLTPLRGMRLTTAYFDGNDVSDLTPLKGMPLQALGIGCNVTDLTPLKGMPLQALVCYGAKRLSDLASLKGMPLKLLNCQGTVVSDLAPLKGMPLIDLNLADTKVTDLAPLKDMVTLKRLALSILVIDLSPLRGLALEQLHFRSFKAERDATILRAMPTLKTINDKPAAEFWKEVDAKAKSASQRDTMDKSLENAERISNFSLAFGLQDG